jgi:hypothetical protein
MSATRERIDRKLDLLESRVTAATDRTFRVARTAAAAVGATAVVWLLARQVSRARRRRRVRARAANAWA